MNKVSRIANIAVFGTLSLLASKDKAIAEPAQDTTAVTQPFLLQAVFQEKAIPVTLTDEGREWINRNEDIYRRTLGNEDGGLIDASTFLASDQAKRIDDCLAGRNFVFSGNGFSFVKLEEPENGYKYVLDVKYENGESERWYISGQAYYRDQFPEGESIFDASIAIWKKNTDGSVDKLTQNYLEFFSLVRGTEGIDGEYLLDKLQAAKEYRKQEQEDLAKIKTFDLPKDRPIAYIGLVDGHDLIFADSVKDTKYFGEMMSSLGYQMITDGLDEIVVEEEPKDLIERKIKTFVDQGITDIYLTLSGHGDDGAIYFTLANDEVCSLSALNLAKIFDEFPECTFYISTEACSGGGFANLLKRYKDPADEDGRITVFLQSKPDALNQEGRLKGTNGINGAPKIFSSYYKVFFAHHILSGKTYGEAHLLADTDAKKLIQCDAEAWRSSPKGGISTTGLFNNNKPLRFGSSLNTFSWLQAV